MGDYVSKAAAINKIMGNIVHQDCHDANLHNIGLRKAMSVIDSLPAADVVEVVRCGDCIRKAICRTLIVWAVSPDDNWFCADGERKEGGPDA